MLYLYFRVSGTLGPGFSGAARFSLSRRAHVKAKGTLDNVEQKNYAVGEQKVGQPRRPALNENSNGTWNGDEGENGNRNVDRIGEGGEESKKRNKPHKS